MSEFVKYSLPAPSPNGIKALVRIMFYVEIDICEIDRAWRFRAYSDGIVMREEFHSDRLLAQVSAERWINRLAEDGGTA